MGIVQIVIIIFSIAGIGFGAGMHLGLIDDSATMYKIQNLLPKNLVLSNGLPFFNLAFLSGQSQGFIDHATVSFGLGKVVVEDEYGTPLYFDNRITECEFHSDEDIDEPICILCRILDTHDDCVDLWIGLDEFEHGLLLNTQILGVTVSAMANGGFPNEVMIFVSDNNVLNDDDPDLETPGVGGICGDCVIEQSGEGMHIAVIPEFITGSAGDGVVDIPDDSASGGTQRWVFDETWFLRSFDFVDYDRNNNGEARAYTNPDCTGLVQTAVISKNPNGGDGSVQTITLNANNVRCLEVEYVDSGGITNIHLECIKKFSTENIIGTGLIDLPDGYTASSIVSIPLFDGGVDVFEAQSVKVEIGKSLIDFDGLFHGDNHATISGYLLSNFGITLEIDGFNGIDEGIIYNSFNVGGADPDLEHPLVPDDLSVGNLLVMKENSGNQPNDSAAGGIIRFKSTDPMSYVSIDVVDHDRGGATSEIRSYKNFDCTDLIDTSDIIADGENNVQTVAINDDNVRCLEIFYEDSGGFTNLQLGCLGVFHEVKNKVKFFFDGFEDESTIWGIWNLDNSRTTTPHPNKIWFGQASAGEIGAHTGQFYLGGSGNIDDRDDTDYDGVTNPAWAAYNRDPIDISQHTDVWLSFWYSYHSTESNDEFAMYYRIDGGAWQEIFNIDPAIGNGNQASWQPISILLPDSGNQVELEFRWESSALISNGDDVVMIDDLELTGVPIP